MSRISFAKGIFFLLVVFALLSTPIPARAGGVCGGIYVAEAGQTIDSIAAMCGMSTSTIYASNPGLVVPLYAGEVLNLSVTVSPMYVNPTPFANYNNYIYYNNYAPIGNNTYTVQSGDTFGGISNKLGIPVYDLWLANPNVLDINLIYPGQTLRLPATYGGMPNPSTDTSTELSYGTVPASAPRGKITLVNRSKSDVYISLQGTTTSGANVISEYPVDSSLSDNIPAAWYVYVAWVGGKKFEGQFHLGGESDNTIIFYSNKVVVQ